MRKLKVLWRATRSQRFLEELDTWSTLLLAIGAALLLYATLKAQAGHGAEFRPSVGAPTPQFQGASGFPAAASLETERRRTAARGTTQFIED